MNKPHIIQPPKFRLRKAYSGKLLYAKHSLHGLKMKKRLLSELESKLKSPDFFKQLENINSGNIRVRKYMYGKIPVVIKDTWGQREHGHHYKILRHIFYDHQILARSKKINAEKYRLISPRVFGRIGDYLVMEYMQGMDFKTAQLILPGRMINSLDEAFIDMRNNIMPNFNRLKYGTPPPKVDDVIVLGNTNPKNPEKGKWLFSIPYDHVGGI